MILVVAEKPSAGRDIARVLGADNKKQGYMEGNSIMLLQYNNMRYIVNLLENDNFWY